MRQTRTRIPAHVTVLALLALVAVLTLPGCAASGPEPVDAPGWVTHESVRFGFAVDVPADWPSTAYGETAPEEGFESPDAGIRLQIDGSEEDWLDIFGQAGTLTGYFDFDAHVSTEPFRTDSGLEGTVSLFEEGDEVRLVYSIDEKQLIQSRFLGAFARMDKERYERHKDVIDRIMKSLRQTGT